MEPLSLKAIGRWFAAEAVGTMLLMLAVGVAATSVGTIAGYETAYLPAVIGAVIALLVYCFGSVSGANLNPAVTLALFAIRKVTAVQVAIYLPAQFFGAFLGAQLAKFMLGSLPVLGQQIGRSVGLAELLGGFIVALVIAAVVIGRVPAGFGGIAIGLGFLVALTVAMGTSGAIINPAIAFAVGSYGLNYLLAPILGACLGAGLFVWLSRES